MDVQAQVRKQLLEQFEGKNAHVLFRQSLKDMPFDKAGIRPQGLPHSVWELAEHIRIGQYDILDFSRNEDYESLDWPDEYWPDSPAPGSKKQWQKMLDEYEDDHQKMAEIIKNKENDLLAPIPHGDGQTLFREALLIVDHTSYHIGQIVQVRRLLDCWK